MSVLRYIAILSFMALITGCDAYEADDYECSPPGYPSYPNCPTNYLFKVVKVVDLGSGQVEVVYPDRLYKRQGRRKDTTYPGPPYKIYVRDLKMLVETGRLKEEKEYVFHNGNGSPFFEVFPETYELKLPDEKNH
jgi:hypothetical protein